MINKKLILCLLFFIPALAFAQVTDYNRQYFNAKQGTVLVISSLIDPDELANVLEQCDAGTVVYFVKLSKVFRHFVAWNWLKRLIFLPPKARLNKLRGRWVFSPIRLQVQKREKVIEELLRRSNVNSGVL